MLKLCFGCFTAIAGLSGKEQRKPCPKKRIVAGIAAGVESKRYLVQCCHTTVGGSIGRERSKPGRTINNPSSSECPACPLLYSYVHTYVRTYVQTRTCFSNLFAILQYAYTSYNFLFLPMCLSSFHSLAGWLQRQYVYIFKILTHTLAVLLLLLLLLLLYVCHFVEGPCMCWYNSRTCTSAYTDTYVRTADLDVYTMYVLYILSSCDRVYIYSHYTSSALPFQLHAVDFPRYTYYIYYQYVLA